MATSKHLHIYASIGQAATGASIWSHLMILVQLAHLLALGLVSTNNQGAKCYNIFTASYHLCLFVSQC